MDLKKLSTLFFNEVYRRSKYKQCEICACHSETEVCDYCKLGFADNHTACALCQLPLPDNATVCGHCQTQPPPYHLCIAPLRFEGITKVLIHNIKFHQQAHYIRPLASLLSDRLIDFYQNTSWPTQLLYVPSHPKRIKERGFCHTQLMAQQLTNQLKQSAYAITPELTTPTPLIKQRHTQAQHTLDKTLRSKSQVDAYQVQGELAEHIALFDDVMTTGNTLESVTRVLLKHGAKRVDIWVLARTPNDKTYFDH